MWSGLQSLGAALMLPVFIHLLYNRWYLSQNEKALIILNTIFLAAVVLAFFIGAWLSTLAVLLYYGMHNLLVLEIARGTQLFRRSTQPCKFSKLTEKFFILSENEFKLIVYLTYFWIGIRAISLKSLTFDLGGGTFVSLIAGWNCLLLDWSTIYAIWLIWLCLALYSCLFLIKYDKQTLRLYKQYLMQYKVLWDIVINSIVLLYHLLVYAQCDKLAECLQLYQNPWLRVLRFGHMWGMSLTSLHFFWKCHGKFQDRRSSETNQTEGSGQQEIELQEMMLDEEYRQRKLSQSCQEQS